MAQSEVRVPFVNLAAQYLGLRDEILEAIDRVGRSGFYILGPNVEEFERLFAEYCDTQHAISCANGTDAIVLVMKALGIGPGDEVITAPNSFIASAGSIIQCGARPIMADVADDYNIDVEQIKKKIGPKTKAIIPVHFTGRAAVMDAINELAQKHGLAVIEDAAQAVGSSYKGRKVGSWGTAGCFSLHPLKNLSVYGDGGMITTNDDDLAIRLKQIRNHGLKDRDHCDFWGCNSRLDELQAAIGVIKMKHIESWNERFREIAQMYRDGLRDIEGPLQLPPADGSDHISVYHNFVIRVQNRSELMRHMEAHGVQSKIHYPIPIHRQQAYITSNGHQENFPKTEEQSQTILSLPIYPELTDEQVHLTINSIRSFFKRES